MAESEKKILYHPRYIIEEVKKIPGLTPVRLFAVLFPLWYIEVAGTYEQQKPYELIERYIERGIAEADFHSSAELAAFFQLDGRLIEKILLFLETIGHTFRTQRGWELTERGQRSLAEDKKYIPKETQQKLYFEAFRSEPLLREHYRNLTPFSDLEADEITRVGRGGYQFTRLVSFPDFDPATVHKLEHYPKSSLYNLHEGIRNLRILHEVAPVYLPIYLIETRQQDGRSYYVAYSHIRTKQSRRDDYFERIVNRYPQIQRALAASASIEQELRVKERWIKWLMNKGAGAVQPEQIANGIWQVILPATVFRVPNSKFMIEEIGSYWLEDGYFLQIWCNDVLLRREAVLERTLQIIRKRRKSITSREVEEHMQHISEQLATRRLELTDLQQRAKDIGATDLLHAIDE